MLEGQALGEKLGVKFHVDVERRINGAVKVGAHKTSMLQDLERGRPMEIDPLVTVVQEMGRLAEVPTPTIDVVLPLLQLRQFMADNPAKPITKPPVLLRTKEKAADTSAAFFLRQLLMRMPCRMSNRKCRKTLQNDFSVFRIKYKFLGTKGLG